MVFGMVRVLSQRTDPNDFPCSTWYTKEGLTTRNVRSGSQWNRFVSRCASANIMTAERPRTVGSARLNAMFDGTPVISASVPNIQYPR